MESLPKKLEKTKNKNHQASHEMKLSVKDKFKELYHQGLRMNSSSQETDEG